MMFKYKKLLELGLINFRPWRILTLKESHEYSEDLKLRYPKRRLVPFALRTDCDDVACWDSSRDEQATYIIHDFASEGWEEQNEFKTFDECFNVILNDMFCFDD